MNPDTTSVRKILTLPRDLLLGIEEYRRTLHPIPSQSEAIRQLIRIGLEAAGAPPKGGRR